MTAERDDDIRAPHLRNRDFLGAFAVVRRGGCTLMVQNERIVHGARTLTWDLPGGQVEPRELLHEALARELREETALEVRGEPHLLFLQEGTRQSGRRRRYAWRSFFFAVDAFSGTPRAQGEVLDLRWFPNDELDDVLTAPYHDSFRIWLREGGVLHTSAWRDRRR